MVFFFVVQIKVTAILVANNYSSVQISNYTSCYFCLACCVLFILIRHSYHSSVSIISLKLFHHWWHLGSGGCAIGCSGVAGDDGAARRFSWCTGSDNVCLPSLNVPLGTVSQTQCYVRTLNTVVALQCHLSPLFCCYARHQALAQMFQYYKLMIFQNLLCLQSRL